MVAAGERDVWGVATDGAFPTSGTMTAYINRWAGIYVQSRFLLSLLPQWVYRFLAGISRMRSQRRLNCRFPDIEQAVRRLSPRPWLLIHGQRDNYIGPEIAQSFFDCAREPKEMWLVPEAKHNRCRECQPEAYAARIGDFLGRFSPRRPLETSPAPTKPSTVRDRVFPADSGLTIGTPRFVPAATASVSS